MSLETLDMTTNEPETAFTYEDIHIDAMEFSPFAEKVAENLLGEEERTRYQGKFPPLIRLLSSFVRSFVRSPRSLSLIRSFVGSFVPSSLPSFLPLPRHF